MKESNYCYSAAIVKLDCVLDFNRLAQKDVYKKGFIIL